MNILRILFLVAIAAAAAVVLYAFLRTPTQIPFGSNTPYYGYIGKGGNFGVQIGDTKSHALELLEGKGFYYAGGYGCLPKLKILINCTEDQKYDLYRLKEPLRQGLMYLEFKDDKITAIIWVLKALPNVDF